MKSFMLELLPLMIYWLLSNDYIVHAPLHYFISQSLNVMVSELEKKLRKPIVQ